MEISHWQRIRLDPSTPVWRRSDGTLVIGHTDAPESRPVEAPTTSSECATLLQLLDGEHSTVALIQSGLAMGITASVTVAFLEALADAGHIQPVHVIPSPRIATNSLRDVGHFAHVRAVPPESLLGRRESARLLVAGDGLIAAALAASATQVGLHTGWQTKNPRKVRLEDCAVPWLNPDARGLRWTELATPIAEPEYVLAIDQTPSARELTSRFGRALVLPLTVHSRRLAVGPLLNLKNGICADCLDSSRMEADPDWAYRLAQITSTDLAPPIIADSFVYAYVGTVVNFVLELIDTGLASSLIEQSWELAPPNPQWRTRRWSRRESCPCNDFQQEPSEQ